MSETTTLTDRLLAEIERAEHLVAYLAEHELPFVELVASGIVAINQGRAVAGLLRGRATALAADRRLVERHKPEVETNVWFGYLPDGTDDYRDVEYCFTCTVGRCCGHGVSWNGQSMLDEAPALWPCDTIRDLAAVYDVPVDGEA